MMNWSGGMGTTGWVFMLIFLLLLIAAAAWVVSRLGTPSIAERPEEILDRRLASGEIDANAYDVLRKKLRAGHA